MESWSRDLLKVLGKFGGSLSQTPEVIYTGVAPFCPTTSSIHTIFGEQQSESLRILGASEDWDDCLARVSVGRETLATVTCCSGRYLAVGSNDGLTLIWDCTTFYQVCTLNHGEGVPCICFNVKGDRLATYGSRTTKIWSPRTGQLIQTIPNQVGMQGLCLQFVDDDAALLVGTDRSSSGDIYRPVRLFLTRLSQHFRRPYHQKADQQHSTDSPLHPIIEHQSSAQHQNV